MPTINTSLAIIGAQLDERGANAFADVLSRLDRLSEINAELVTALNGIQPMRNAEFSVKFPGIRGARWDGYSKIVGRSPDNQVLPVERSITYKSHPSRHECNAKCMGGKINGTCECSCGGRNHGIRGA